MTRQGLPTATTFAGKSRNDHACANLSATVVRYEILATCFVGHRDMRYVEHTVQELVSQRFHGLVLGYENLNDHDHLRQWQQHCAKKDQASTRA
jgi:hypothetical protein